MNDKKKTKAQPQEISDSLQSEIRNQAAPHGFSEVIVPSSGNVCKMTAEDDEYLRGLSEIMLKQLDYRVILSADGRKPLNLLEKNRSIQDSLLAGLASHYFSGKKLAALSTRESRSIFHDGHGPAAQSSVKQGMR